MRKRKPQSTPPPRPAAEPVATPASPARPRLLLVDYENVQQVDLTKVDESFRVAIFVGASQKSIPLELVTSAQKLGKRVEWHKISGDGRNALDFFIAWHLGRVFEASPRPECTILSRDKGFDPLIKHLNARGMKCRRVDTLGDMSSAAPGRADDPTLKRVMDVLGKSDKRSRPRKRRTLAQAISAMFQKKLPRQDIDRVIDTLMSDKLISEKHGIITYEF